MRRLRRLPWTAIRRGTAVLLVLTAALWTALASLEPSLQPCSATSAGRSCAPPRLTDLWWVTALVALLLIPELRFKRLGFRRWGIEVEADIQSLTAAAADLEGVPAHAHQPDHALLRFDAEALADRADHAVALRFGTIGAAGAIDRFLAVRGDAIDEAVRTVSLPPVTRMQLDELRVRVATTPERP